MKNCYSGNQRCDIKEDYAQQNCDYKKEKGIYWPNK